MKLNFNILTRIIPKFMIIKFTENSKIVIVKDLFNEYSDIKYLIVETRLAFQELIKKINSLCLDENIEKDLISKIIIWEESEGDF